MQFNGKSVKSCGPWVYLVFLIQCSFCVCYHIVPFLVTLSSSCIILHLSTLGPKLPLSKMRFLEACGFLFMQCRLKSVCVSYEMQGKLLLFYIPSLTVLRHEIVPLWKSVGVWLRQSQDSWCWQGSLEVILFNIPVQAGSPRAGCPADFWASSRMETLELLCAPCVSA